MTTPAAHVDTLNANARKHPSFNFRNDLLDIIGSGEINANETDPASCAEGTTWGDIAIRTIGGLLCERDLGLRHGSNQDRIRKWFFRNGVSF